MRVMRALLKVAKIAIAHLSVGLSPQNQKINFQGHENPLGQSTKKKFQGHENPLGQSTYQISAAATAPEKSA